MYTCFRMIVQKSKFLKIQYCKQQVYVKILIRVSERIPFICCLLERLDIAEL